MPEPKSTKKLYIVGEQVAAARGLLKMRQAELIEATGVSKATIIRFEAGGSVPEYQAAREAAITRGYLTLHPSGAYFTFTQAGADLFA